MTRINIITLTCTTALALIILVVLLIINPGSRYISGNFERRFFSRQMQHSLLSDRYNFVSIAGYHNDSLYVQTDIADNLIRVSKDLRFQENLRLYFPGRLYHGRGYNYQLRYPKLYLKTGNKPVILEMDMHNHNIRIDTPKSRFTHAVMAGSSNYHTIAFSKALSKNQIIYSGTLGDDSFTEHDTPYSLDSSFLFAADGLLHHDEHSNSSVYLPFYKAGFYLIGDTLKQQNTIVPAAHNRKMSGRFNKKGQYVNTSPRRPLQLLSDVDRGRIYIQSTIYAANQTGKEATTQLTVDVYSILSGRYLGSFYLPPFNGSMPIRFKVIDRQVYCLYKNALTSFTYN